MVASLSLGATNSLAGDDHKMPSFDRMDKNGNGEIRREEFRQFANPNQQSRLWDKTVDDIEDRVVINADGKEIGEVDELAYNQRTDSVNVIIEVGGFLGIGETKVAIPLDEINFQDDKIQWSTRYTEDQLKNRYSYIENDHRELSEDLQLSSVRDGVFQEGQQNMERVSKRASGRVDKSFDELDQNRDGILTKEEAREADASRLTENWARADKNNNDKLERSEFSAFEMRDQKQY